MGSSRAPHSVPPTGAAKGPEKQELLEGGSIWWMVLAWSFRENRGPWLKRTLSNELPRGSQAMPSLGAASRQRSL